MCWSVISIAATSQILTKFGLVGIWQTTISHNQVKYKYSQLYFPINLSGTQGMSIRSKMHVNYISEI